MGTVGIVCDSTCDLGPAWLADHDVVMVPLKVTFGEKTYLDWIELGTAEFYEMLATSPVLPKTSQPSPAEFSAVYEKLAAAGCTEIVSIHLTSKLSGTIASAEIAARTSPVPVRIVDTRTVNMGLALAVMAALDVRSAGGDVDAIHAAAQHVADTGHLYFALDTLEYLVKGGRAGKAQGLAASLLNIKPVLTFDAEGAIEPYKKVKGTKKALQEIAQTAIDAAGQGPVKAGILHAQAPDLVEELRVLIAAADVPCEIVHCASVGAVIGTYAGPRAIGLAFYPLS